MYRLTPTVATALSTTGGARIVEWTSSGSGKGGGIVLPSGHGNLRLRISELDYYRYADEGLPAAANTNQRRPFVAHIPVRGGVLSRKP